MQPVRKTKAQKEKGGGMTRLPFREFCLIDRSKRVDLAAERIDFVKQIKQPSHD